jgi:hypothetical protein
LHCPLLRSLRSLRCLTTVPIATLAAARSATAPCSLRSPLYCSMLRRSLRSHAAWQLCSGCPVSAALRRPATVGAHTGGDIEEALCCAAAWLHCAPAPFRPRGDAAREKPAPAPLATLAAPAQLRRRLFCGLLPKAGISGACVLRYGYLTFVCFAYYENNRRFFCGHSCGVLGKSPLLRSLRSRNCSEFAPLTPVSDCRKRCGSFPARVPRLRQTAAASDPAAGLQLLRVRCAHPCFLSLRTAQLLCSVPHCAKLHGAVDRASVRRVPGSFGSHPAHRTAISWSLRSRCTASLPLRGGQAWTVIKGRKL